MFCRFTRRFLHHNRFLVSKHLKLSNSIACISPHYSQVSYKNFVFYECGNNLRNFSDTASNQIDPLKFEEVCGETLESLCDYFEELIEKCNHLKGADVVYGDGVLTVVFGEPFGTYVINRQTPNKQIWLSSPVSGPKRYDFVMNDNGYWIYKHDGVTLHQLLQSEINKIVHNQADFSNCSYSLV